MSLGSRLRAARAGAGLSLRGLARQVSVSHTAIANYESDRDVPSSPVLISLVEALGVDIAFLFRSREVRLGSPVWRKRPSLKKAEQDAILAKAQDVLERYLEVEDLLGEMQGGLRLSIRLSPIRALEDVERAAQELRAEWQLGLSSIEDLSELLERNGVRVIYVDAAPAFDACALKANDQLPVIVLNSNFPGDRLRFNLAHELAHIVLDVRENVDEEKAAHRFAGSFLFPEQMVIQELGIRRSELSVYELHVLKHRWGLSMQSIVLRAKEAGILNEAATDRMLKEFRVKGWNEREPGDQYPAEGLERFQRLVMKALTEDIVSRTKASELLGMPLDDFRESVIRRHGEDLVDACY